MSIYSLNIDFLKFPLCLRCCRVGMYTKGRTDSKLCVAHERTFFTQTPGKTEDLTDLWSKMWKNVFSSFYKGKE